MAKISPCSTLMSTLLTATKPPKRLVSPRVSRIGIDFLGRAQIGHGLIRGTTLQLHLALGARKQALRSQQHDAGQDDAEDQEVRALDVATDVELGQKVDVEGRRGAGDPPWQLNQDIRLDGVDEQRADDHAADAAHPPEHHHHEHYHRYGLEAERLGAYEEHLRRVIGASESTEGG